MKPIQEYFGELLAQGCCFRYSPERFSELTGGGQPFLSPTRVVNTPSGDMVEELIQPVLNPIVARPDDVQALRKLAASWPTFLRAQLEIFSRARRGDLDAHSTELVKTMCTRREWERGDVEPGYRIVHPFIRLDAVRTSEGFKVIDINSTRPAGVGDLIGLQTSLNGSVSSAAKPFCIGTTFTRVVQHCVDQWASTRHLAGESIPVDIAVRHTDGDWRNFENLCRQLVRSGINARLVEPEALRLGDPTAIIRSRIKEGDPAYAALSQGYPDQRCVLSPLYRRFLGNKLWMYAFRISPFREIFSEMLGARYALFDDVFPEIGEVCGHSVRFPSRCLEVSTLDRREWVLKDPASSSGRRMFLGFHMTRTKWQGVLEQATSGWIAQRYYPTTELLTVAGPDGEPVERKLFTKYGIYIFDDVLAGLEFNARPVPVVHGARNTYCSPVLQSVSASS